MNSDSVDLAKKMHTLFDNDEFIQEWILIGKLPVDIAEIAAEALGSDKAKELNVNFVEIEPPEEFTYLGRIIQQEFFPNAPPLERGGFLKALTGQGEPPFWLVMFQSATQIMAVAQSKGFEVQDDARSKD